MGFFKSLAKGFSWLVNPLGNIIDQFQHTNDNSHRDETGRLVYNNGTTVSPGRTFLNKVGDKVGGLWNDFTGQTAVEMQNQANLDLAKYQSAMQEELYNKYSSPEALMRQYQEAGLNPNLMYGGAGSGQGNVPSFSLPQVHKGLSTYDKLQAGMSLVHGLLNLQNIKYNVDASREIAEQSGIKTLNLFEDLIGKRNKNKLNSSVTGFNTVLDFKPKFKLSLLGRQPELFKYSYQPNIYSQSMRNYQLNRAMELQHKLNTEYGSSYSFSDRPYNFLGEGYIPNYWWRNQVLRFDAHQRQFNYDWDQDFKTIFKSAGFVGPVLKLLYSFFK